MVRRARKHREAQHASKTTLRQQHAKELDDLLHKFTNAMIAADAENESLRQEKAQLEDNRNAWTLLAIQAQEAKEQAEQTLLALQAENEQLRKGTL